MYIYIHIFESLKSYFLCSSYLLPCLKNKTTSLTFNIIMVLLTFINSSFFLVLFILMHYFSTVCHCLKPSKHSASSELTCQSAHLTPRESRTTGTGVCVLRRGRCWLTTPCKRTSRLSSRPSCECSWRCGGDQNQIRKRKRGAKKKTTFVVVVSHPQTLAVLQQPPPDPEGVLLPAAAPPHGRRRRVGPHRREGRPGRFSVWTNNNKNFHPLETVTPLAQPFTDMQQGFFLGGPAKCCWRCNWGGPPCVQERQLSDSFRLYTEHCLCLMKNMRQVFPCTSAAAISRYEIMLR